MAYPVATGGPNYTGNFIPEIWAGKLIVNFYDSTILSAISNTDYEGSIKSHGDTVNIRTSPEVTIRDYEKGQTLQVERPDKPKLQLVIDKGNYFQCVEDDIDKVQSDIALMDAWSRDAAEKMKIVIDERVLAAIFTEVHPDNKGAAAGRISENINLGTDAVPISITKDTVLKHIINHGTVLDEANCPQEGRFIVLPAAACAHIKLSDLKDASITGDGSTPLRNGRVGMIDNFTIYKSHLLNHSGPANAKKFNVIAGIKMGFTFASQMTNMETLRAESTFGSLIRGLQVYGFKTVKPEALSTSVVTIAAT